VLFVLLQSVCEGAGVPAELSLPPEVRTFVLYVLLCNMVLLSVMKEKGGKNGLPIRL